jgi:hypothetical protein
MGGTAMARVESAARYRPEARPTPAPTLYEGPRLDDEFTRTQLYLYSLVHFATEGMDRINLACQIAPPLVVLLVVFTFLALCDFPPGYPTAAALLAACMWWFLVMTLRRYILRGIVAAALIFEICHLLASTWYLPNPFKL